MGLDGMEPLICSSAKPQGSVPCGRTQGEVRAVAQDVGDADPTASPLQGNSHLQPPLHHPDVSLCLGGWVTPNPSSFHFPQALQIARRKQRMTWELRLPCVVGHIASTAGSERGRQASHSSVP